MNTTVNINIDTDKLLEEISKLETQREALNNIFTNSTQEIKALDEDWQSDTSKVVDEEFVRFDTAANEYIEKIDSLINYLKDIVTDSYIEYETVENKLIDENIATN
jgi:uncharacterized protein YukE